MEPKVILVRHGHTKLNGSTGTSQDRIRGWKDVPLDDRGIKDAKKVRDELNKKYEIDCIYSSDLSRALETAKISNVHKLPITALMELRPWNLGIFQGQETKKILEDMNNMVRHEEIAPKDGEPFEEFRRRFLGQLVQIIDEAIAYEYQTAVFTHFRDLKCAQAWIAKGCPANLSIDPNVMMKNDFEPGALYELPLHEIGEAVMGEEE